MHTNMPLADFYHHQNTNNKEERERHVLAIIMMTNIDNLLCIFICYIDKVTKSKKDILSE